MCVGISGRGDRALAQASLLDRSSQLGANKTRASSGTEGDVAMSEGHGAGSRPSAPSTDASASHRNRDTDLWKPDGKTRRRRRHNQRGPSAAETHEIKKKRCRISAGRLFCRNRRLKTENESLSLDQKYPHFVALPFYPPPPPPHNACEKTTPRFESRDLHAWAISQDARLAAFLRAFNRSALCVI